MPTDGASNWAIIYDGQCRFCIAGAKRLAKWLPQNKVELIDYHQPGALDRFPSLTPDACAAAMQVVSPAGSIYRGAEGLARAVASRSLLWRWALLYYIPGVRWICDRMYAFIAANRYRIAGRVDSCPACSSGACKLPGTHHH